MGGVKKQPVKSTKQSKNGSAKWQIVALVLLIVFFVVSLMFLWLYASNKPNFRDLKQAYNKLNIPSDWQLVNEYNKTGTAGMFCLNNLSDTSPCPVLSKEFKTQSVITDQILLTQTFNEIFSNFSNAKIEEIECTNIGESEYYRCFKEIIINKTSLYVSVSNINSKSEKGSWGTVVITPIK